MEEIKNIAARFATEGDVLSAERYGNGHINRTYLVTTTQKRYILQKINDKVFPDTDALMENIDKVTVHLRQKEMETLEIVPTREGATYLADGKYRMYKFIENAVAYDLADSAETFEKVGFAFGQFQNALADFDASQLHETIKDFHNTPKRLENFFRALAADTHRRADDCAEEVEFVLARKNYLDKVMKGIARGDIPLRVTHNDTKLNNILLDKTDGRVRAVIDLDTVMSGSLLYDFGDSIRFGAATAAEDETDLDKVDFDLSLFAAYTRGFCGAVRDTLTAREARLLPYGAYLMTMECGIRFLTDYLDGDVYFATKYAEHNLVRCRTQFKLALQMQLHEQDMKKIVRDVLKGL